MAALKPVQQTLPSTIYKNMLGLVYLFIAVVLCLPIALVLYLGRYALPPALTRAALALKPSFLDKDPALAGFFHELWSGPVAVEAGQAEHEEYGPISQQLEQIARLSTQLNRSAEGVERQKTLTELAEAYNRLKRSCYKPGLQVLWQTASLLERLVTQLVAKPSELTHSCLRTLAGGVDLLRRLSCAENLEPHLVTRPPIKLLAVDDNPICLRAVSAALKNAFPSLDLASGADRAFELTQGNAYDAIFLDVEMPGLDGFELCSKIHETALNSKTPVVFVTSHSDFDSRAKSVVSGGTELIGKPFLSAEMTFKAFALVASRRLQMVRDETPVEVAVPPRQKIQQVTPRETASESREVSPGRQEQPAKAVRGGRRSAGPKLSGTRRAQTSPEPKSPAATFFTEAASRLRSAQTHLASLNSGDKSAVGQCLEPLRLCAQSLDVAAQRAQQEGAHQLAFAIQGLLRKLLDRPVYATDSCLSALSEAFTLFNEIVEQGAAPRLGDPPPRVLVVDDDPVSLRAIASALQCNFTKPITADNGEEAVALAGQKQFDLVFMDVRMPGMDGFAACSGIRQTVLNEHTPVVFVTSLRDAQSKELADSVEGSGFIVKPVVPSEIRLSAVTHCLRSRLNSAQVELLPA